MNGFSGTVYHQVDEKGRVRIPSKIFPKAEKEGEEQNCVIKVTLMAGAQGCISVYRQEELAVRLEKLRAISDSDKRAVAAKRKILGSIAELETDKQGRVVIPIPLRAYAQIKKEVVTIGMDDHFEIWAKEVFDKMDSEMSFEEAYSEVGFF